MRVLTVLVAVILTACVGLADNPLPAARIRGVTGQAITYCWQNVCHDGSLARGYPALPATGPYPLELSAKWRSITAKVSAGQQQQVVPINPDLTLGPLPKGDWDNMTVVVEFDPTGNALYAWSAP